MQHAAPGAPARDLTIERVQAIPLHIEVAMQVPGGQKRSALSCVLVRVDTACGLTGCGFTAITEEEVVAAAIDHVAADALVGASALDTEKLWERLYWLLAPRGQSGYAAHAMAAVDIALWDLKAQRLGLPLWRLLGGARPAVPVYATFGFNFLDRDQLAEAAAQWVARGFSRLKMTVGNHGLQRRDEPRPLSDLIREDEARVRAVRQRVGPQVELCIDANCSLDPYHARMLAARLADCDIAFFEEPVTQNDARALADLRRRAPMPLAGGQNEGQAARFADFFHEQSLDIVQPNVAITGGYTQCLRIAGMAQACNVAIANGGAWPFHNMHLHAGLAHGGFIEYHTVAVQVCEQIYTGLPAPDAGWLPLPETPGLGFAPDWSAIAEIARRPLSRGHGKH